MDLQKLIELNEKRTPGPWQVTRLNTTPRNKLSRIHPIFGEISYQMCGDTVFEQGIDEPQDADFIVELANNFDEIVKRLKAAEELEKAVADLEPCDSLLVDIGGTDQTDGYKYADKQWRHQCDSALAQYRNAIK